MITTHKDFFSHIEQNKYAVILKTDYDEFETIYGISGLAKTTGDRLNLLAIIAERPGTGQFHEFMTAAKARFNTIYVWVGLSPDIGVILDKWGFISATEIMPDKEKLKGWKWNRGIIKHDIV